MKCKPFVLDHASLCLAALLLSGAAQAQVATPGNTASSNPLGLSIHHATMGVASIATERAFYHDVLGFAIGPLRNRPHYDLQQMLIPGFRIDMIEQKGSTRPAATMGTDKQGWLHVAFTIADAPSLYAAMKARGVTVAPGRMDGDRLGSVFVTDPEGNRLELAQP